VRETERRAREAAGRDEPGAADADETPRAARSFHPDQVEAAARLGDALGRALGADVRVAPRGAGYKLTLDLGSYDEAVALAERLGALEQAI
jgi:ParB family chromosome partitioning protein